MAEWSAEVAERTAPGSEPGLLEIEDLVVEFRTEQGWVRVVDRLDLSIPAGRTVGLVGESGSGKTVTSLAIMGLLRGSSVRIPSGSIRLEGRELLGLSEQALTPIRGEQIAMIFQEPRRSLNPAFTVGEQIAEVLRRHRGASRSEARRRAIEMLDVVGIADAERRAHDYPHQFSGGMCQRVMLAIALVCEPKLLIADEPTTALDVTVQSRMLELMNDLQAQFGLSILFITHDLAVVAEMCDEVAVLYGGQLMEHSGLDDLFHRPRHPYTEGLLAAIPDPRAGATELRAIPGVVPAPWDWPTGCRFHPRCQYAVPGRCDVVPIELVGDPGRAVRCVRADEISPTGVRG